MHIHIHVSIIYDIVLYYIYIYIYYGDSNKNDTIMNLVKRENTGPALSVGICFTSVAGSEHVRRHDRHIETNKPDAWNQTLLRIC